MNISANGQNYNFKNESGSLNVMGSSNNIILTQCNATISVMGNGNNIKLSGCKCIINANGNGNVFDVSGASDIGIGVNGNGNEVNVQELINSQAKPKIKINHNNGFGNTFPSEAANTQSKNFTNTNKNPIWSNIIENNIPQNLPQQNPYFQYQSMGMPYNNNMMNGQYGFMGMQNSGYNQYPMPNMNFSGLMPPPPPQYPINNPLSYLQNNYQSNFGGNNVFYGPPDNNIPNRNQSRANIRNNNNPNSNSLRFQKNNNNPNNKDVINTNRNVLRNIGTNSNNNSNNNPNSRRNFLFNNRPHIVSSDDDEPDDEIFVDRRQIRQQGQQGSRYAFNPNPRARYGFNIQETIPGLSEKQIKFLPVSKHKGTVNSCSICLQNMNEGQDIAFLTCFHSFHSKCAFSWLRKSATCPLCQIDIRQHLKN